MNFESELAELDDKEYRKLKRVIVKNRNELKGLDEEEKLTLLTRWIGSIKEDRQKKVEEIVENKEIKEESYAQESIFNEEPDKKVDEDFVEVIDVKNKSSGFNWKLLFGIFLLVILLVSLVGISYYLLKPSNQVKLSDFDDYSVLENESLTVPIVAKNAMNLSVYNLPKGASLESNSVVWTPNFSQSGSYIIEACAFNNISSDCKNLSITVKDVNLAPKMISAYPKSKFMWIVDKPIIFFVNVSDFDQDSLTYSWSIGGIFGKKIMNGNAINITFGSTGKKTVKIKVSDGEFSVTREWTVEVVKPVDKRTKSYIVSGATTSNSGFDSYIIGDKETIIDVVSVGEPKNVYVLNEDSEKAIQVERVSEKESNSVIIGESEIEVVKEQEKNTEFLI